jgi:hypothetical protein
VREAVGPATHPLGAIQAKLEQQIPYLYRELALYLQVLRDVLPASLDQACAHMASQVYPRRYNRLSPRVRQHLHTRLKTLLKSCCSHLTVEQLQTLAAQMARERQRHALREQSERMASEAPSEHGDSPLPPGSIQLHLTPPLSSYPIAWPSGLLPSELESSFSDHVLDSLLDDDEEMERSAFPAFIAAALLASGEGGSSPEASLWSSGQLPRDPVLLIQWLDGLDGALSRRLRNLSHSVNMELMRAGLVPGLVPVRLLDSVLSGQIESQGAPANLLRLPLHPHEAGRPLHAPLGVLLRTVDLEMEQPRLRTCRRRWLHHRQEILKMAESFHRLQRRLQAQHAERLWRQDSQLNPPEGT